MQYGRVVDERNCRHKCVCVISYTWTTILATLTSTIDRVFPFFVYCSNLALTPALILTLYNRVNYRSQFVRPPVTYDNWDADKIQGCVCDDGFEGFDCSLRSCPKGRDPTEPRSVLGQHREEVFELQCQADAGYIAILVRGMYTDAIPHDASPGDLRDAFAAVPGVGEVEVVMPAQDDGLPALCGSSAVSTTTITFLDFEGDRPPIFLTRNTSDTRRWPRGSTALSLGGSESDAVLRMSTSHTLTCTSTCVDCVGRIYFTFENSISPSVNVTQDGAVAAIESAIAQLEDLSTSGWTNLEIDVTRISGSLDRVCGVSESSSISIKLYSDYGNLPFLGLIDSSQYDSGVRAPDDIPINITLSTNAGTGQLYECSRQGTCDYTSGVCACFLAYVLHKDEWAFRATSSDGRGQLGTRGDCGMIETRVSSCFFEGRDICSGHGFCSNTTTTCECYDGWAGITCERKDCPMGRAWFDEPLNGYTAHDFVECSGAGTCRRDVGLCECNPGYTGQACDIRDCIRSESGTDIEPYLNTFCRGYLMCDELI